RHLTRKQSRTSLPQNRRATWGARQGALHTKFVCEERKGCAGAVSPRSVTRLSGYCCWAAAAPPPPPVANTRLPSAVVTVATPMLVEVAIFARRPLTVTLS